MAWFARLSLCAAFLIQGSLAHICLLRPPQRGPLDVSEAGSHTCFRHGAPCGGQTGAKPTFALKAGETFFFKWQQNFNHYEVGFPGYMDLAIAPVDSTEFTFLAGFGDFNWHQQSHQLNYTVPAIVPDMDCQWCVLRVRYVPHKPGEDIFYQCADMAIYKTDASDKTQAHTIDETEAEHVSGRLAAAARLVRARPATRRQVKAASGGVYGLACNPVEMPNGCQFVRIAPDTGLVEKIKGVPYGVDAEGALPDHKPNDFILDQISAFDGEHLYYLTHMGPLDAQTSSLISLNPTSGALSVHGALAADSVAINALDYDSKTKQLLSLQIVADKEKEGNFFFRVSRVDPDHGTLTTIHQTSTPEDLYVNYQWSTVDTTRGVFYYLMGNENDAYGLTARLYSVDVTTGAAPEPVAVVAKVYTVGAIQYDSVNERLVALSPGLFNQTSPGEWSIVVVDPKTGSVTYLCHVGPANIFQVDYSGAIFNIDQGVLYARLRVWNEPADVIVSVQMEKDTCHVQYSQLGNFYHIHNMAYLP